MLVEEIHEVYQLVVTQTVVAEVHHTLHSAFLAVLDDPAQVLQLQVGDAHMLDHPLALQLVQSRQCLVDHLLQSTLHASLKLNVMNVDDVDVVDVQALQTLVDALLGTTG